MLQEDMFLLAVVFEQNIQFLFHSVFGGLGEGLDCIARRILKIKYETVLSSSKCKYLMTTIKWVYDVNRKNKAKHWHLNTVGNRTEK